MSGWSSARDFHRIPSVYLASVGHQALLSSASAWSIQSYDRCLFSCPRRSRLMTGCMSWWGGKGQCTGHRCVSTMFKGHREWRGKFPWGPWGKKRMHCARQKDAEARQGRILGGATSRRNWWQEDNIYKQTCSLPWRVWIATSLGVSTLLPGHRCTQIWPVVRVISLVWKGIMPRNRIDQNVCSPSTSDPHFTPLRLLEKPTTNYLAMAWSCVHPLHVGFYGPSAGCGHRSWLGWGPCACLHTGPDGCTFSSHQTVLHEYHYCSVPSLS